MTSDVADALRAFAGELAQAGAVQTGGSFTDLAEADAFVKTVPEAFLVGVLFTQGIPAERAWAAPYLLGQRLGHFDLERIAAGPTAVAGAVATAPALHRFVRTLPGWVCKAASRVLAEYHGSAEAIWEPGTHVLEVHRRLVAFDGIGDKKAAMATELLMRHFGAQLQGVECASVAYDVHVRRVFLRSGLADEDTPAAIADAARLACPAAPGSLDLAAWLVGRDWCRPRDPRCDECRLRAVCPRLVERNAQGVGARRAQASGRKSSPDSSLG